ncbi:hypothetical protein [Lysobacter gummosus]|uniref:hypothetical protein n=1 Tax=Lysobacter gummosus TaxID=262324 RepID=UPI00363789C7
MRRMFAGTPRRGRAMDRPSINHSFPRAPPDAPPAKTPPTRGGARALPCAQPLMQTT